MNNISETPSIFRLLCDVKTKAAFQKLGLIMALSTLLPLMSFASPSHFITQVFLQIRTTVQTELQKTQKLYSSPNQVTIHEATSFSSMMPPCPGGSGVIGGIAFQDFNHNGDNDQIGTIEGLQVGIFSCDADGNTNLVSSTTTDENGHYFFDGLTDGVTYRVQFFLPTNLDFLSPGSGAGEAGTDVQFITSPSCDAHIGYLDINDYCEEDPFIVAACYVNGDPLAPNSGSADEDVLVAFRYSSTGNDPKIMLAKGAEMGSTYGLAYQKETKQIFAAAFIKRHVGLGPLGLGGIYQVDWTELNNPVVSPFVDVADLGLNVGSMLANADRGLSANPAIPNNDPLAYDAVGKMGLGGMDISPNGEMLWFMNLNTQTLHRLVIDSDGNPDTPPSSSDMAAFPLPSGGCSGGSLRPFAVKIYQGKVYVGAVCDAAMSQDAGDLEAIVYELNGSSFNEVLRFDLDYEKGYTTFTNDCEDFPGWYPWRADLPPACSSNGIFRVYPTPILSDLAFDSDGDLMMGFTDRMGHQIGFKNYPLEGTEPLLQTVSGGDLLRADNDNGTYVLENNGTVGGLTSAGAGNNEGPGGGEFYYRDVFEGPIDNLVDPVPHTETSQGALAMIPGKSEVVTTALDPYSTLFNAGGVNWMNNTNGMVQNPGFVLYRTSNSDISTFSKANGLGDIVPICGLAPLEIGSYVWKDANENGLQDACEEAFTNINVALYDTEGNLLTTSQTDDAGEFYFNEFTPNFDGIMPNTTYIVVVGTEGDFNVAAGVLTDAGTITTANVAGQIDSDQIDSDALIADESIANGAIAGLPYIQVTTGGAGFTDHSNDFGFTSSPPDPVTVTGEVFIDENGDGIQDANEAALAGVTVQLYHQDGTLAGETTSDANGDYIFTVEMGGVYYIQFETNPSVDGTNYDLTLQNQGDDDSVDSDPDPTTGQTVNFPVVLNSDGVTDVDAGYQEPQPVTVTGTVFIDENGDGINDNNEGPIAGVTVQLYFEDGTLADETTTNADGTYSFSVPADGVYYIQFETNPSANGTDYELTLQNQGNDDTVDSDPDPTTGITMTFTVVLNGEGITNIDAGYQEVIQATASIGDLVFKDCNENGIQDSDEAGIPNVQVTLTNSEGQTTNTTTDENGIYGFSDLTPGAYTLSFSLPNISGLEFSSNLVSDNGQTGNINLDEGEIEDGIDIAVIDVEAPQFTGTLPQDMTVEDCDSGNLPEPATLTATDNCDEDVEITFDENTEDNGGNDGCAGANIVRTWTATDDCGNSVSHTQRISLNDNEAPTFVGNLPQDMELDCSETPPAPPTLTATDNCDNDVEVSLEGVMNDNDGSCVGRSMTRTWTATDDCGNSVSHTQVITFIDNTPPTFNGNLPQDISGEDCTVNDLPNPPNISASDDCDDDVEVTFGEVLMGGNIDGCAGNTLVRTWTATDDCGNSVSHAQTIVFGDNTPPFFTGVLPPNMNGVECGDFDINNPPTLTAEDNCDPSVFISFSQEIDENPSECAGGTITRTWIATDDCGNAAEYTQTITFDDNTPPVITGVPDDVTVECDDIPGMPLVKGIDDCGGAVDLVFTETQQGDCPITITRTWTAVDNCGNSAMDSQVITVIDTIPPVIFYSNPHLVGMQDGDTLIVSCDNVPVLTNLDVTVFDNCDANPDVDFVDFIVNSTDCLESGYLAYMFCGWVVTDACDNVTQLTIHVLVEDNTPPVLEGVPDDVVVGQNGELPPIADVSATDNCDDNVHIDFDQEVMTQDCGSVVRRTWTATDDCGNEAIDVQIIVLSADCDCPNDIITNVNSQDAGCGLENGSIAIDVFGDIEDYIITWTPNIGTSNAEDTERTDLPAGVYVVQVEFPFSTGCFEKVVVEISGEDAVVPNTDVRAVTCPGGSDGSIQSDDGRIYDITQNGTQIGTTPVFNILAGTYTISYENSDGCATAIDVTVPEPPALDITSTTADVTCAGGDGAISLTVTGGTSPYTFAWTDNVSTTSFANNLAPGNYGITVTDNKGCTNETTLSIGEDCECDLTISATANDATCGMSNGSVMVSAAGSIFGNLVYTWSPDVSTSNMGTGLAAGTYSITATDETSGCEAFTSVTIENTNLPQTPDVSLNEPSCAGECDGSITADNNRVYNILQDGAVLGQTPLTGLCAGSYTINYGDDNGCNVTMNVTLEEPTALMASSSVEPDSCDLGVGSIVLTVDGGTAPYTFDWTPEVSSNGIATGLNTGTYAVVITDDNGCTVEMNNITIGEADCEFTCDISLTSSVTPDSCEVGQGAIMISVSGGAAPFTYTWSDDISNDDTAIGLNAGTYAVTVTDANDCSAEMANITVGNIDCEVVCDITLTSSVTPDSCEVGQGAIMIGVSGGTAPFTYTWSDDVSNDDTAIGLNAGTYAVTVTDANDCSAEMANITVGNIDCELVCDITLTSSVTPDSCEVGQGAIMISVSGGTAPFTYTWSDDISSDDTATGLNAGTYAVTVTDANDCSAEMANITVGNTDCETVCDLVITSSHSNASCNQNNGTIEVTVENAIGNLTYNWNPDVSDGATATDLEAGVYVITAIDNMTGCVAETMVTIEQVDMPDPIDATITNPSCAGLNDGMISSNDGRVYDVRRNNALVGQTPLNGLGVGIYTISYTDNEDCSISLVVEITAPAPLSLEVTAVPDTCDTGVGSLVFEVSGGTEPYTYQLEGEAATDNPVIGGLSAAIYNGTVTDANGCSLAFSNLPLSNICPCALSASATALPDTCEMGVGEISIEIIGATEPISYEWSDGITDTDNLVVGLSEGSYSVTATDANNCTIALENINVINICPCSLEATATVQGATCGESNGSISIEVLGGQGNLIYDWTPNVSTTNTATDLPAGDYRIEINDDATPCMLELNITISGSEGAEAPDAIAIQPTCPEDLGTIDANDNRIYRVVQDGESFGFTPVDDLEAGIYTATYTASNGCTASVEMEIMAAPAEWDVEVTTTESNCEQDNGTITLDVSGANGGYTYVWEGDVSTSNTANDLAPGTYDVTITDSEGCEYIENNILIDDDCLQGGDCDNFTVGVIDQQYEFCDLANGFIEVEVSGGQGNIIYDWVGSNSTTSLADGLISGTYSLTVIDQATGCTAELTETIGELAPPPVPEVIAVPQTCSTDEDGSIYSLDGRTYLIMQGSNTIGIAPATTLVPGIYTVFFTDTNGCSSSIDIEVGAVAAINIDVSTVSTTCDENDGSIMLEVTGGTPPYNFIWQANISNNQEATGLPPGNYQVTVTDDNDCQSTATITVENDCFAPDCPPVESSFASNYLLVEETSGMQCVPLRMADVMEHEIYLDGELYEEEVETCLMDSLISYSYTDVFTLDGGAYEINWTTDDTEYTGTVHSMYELSDSLNRWNPNGNWSNDPGQHILLGGVSPFDYGNLVITHSSGNTAHISPHTSGEIIGVAMDLGTHADMLVLVSPEGCTDSLEFLTPEEAENLYFQYVNFTLEMTGEDDGEDVLLTWMTINETENGRFYIEHSLDSVHFRTLPKMIEGKGPANEVNVYQERHESPHVGWNYYRIVYLDNRGRVTRTIILKIFFKPKDSTDVQVYPNPFVNETTIDFLHPLEEAATVQLVDVWGQVLRIDNVLANETKHLLDVSAYPSGIYFVFINYNKHRRAIHRIVKEN